jgi:hypothetical protein
LLGVGDDEPVAARRDIEIAAARFVRLWSERTVPAVDDVGLDHAYASPTRPEVLVTDPRPGGTHFVARLVRCSAGESLPRRMPII